jgi:hypothetical protein
MVDLNHGSLTPYQRLQLGMNPRGVVGFAVGVFLALAIPAGLMVWYAFRPGQVVATRFIYLALASLGFAIPFRIAAIAFRRRWTTGSWFPSVEERMELRGNTDGRPLPSSISPLIVFMYLIVAADGLVVAIRGKFDPWNYGFVIVWLLFSGHSMWQMLGESRKAASGQ